MDDHTMKDHTIHNETMNDHTTCCIAGGGPAGVMLGYVLARAGVEVLVLEKHQDFFRDFRGDTIHPSTLEIMHELGLLEELLRLPHQEVRGIEAHFGDRVMHLADLSHLPTHCKFVALMPQWDFLNFLTGHAQKFPQFRIRMQTEVTDLLFERDRVAGVKARTPEGTLDVRAELVVGADGRTSTVRERAGLELVDLGAPIDVLWFRVKKKDDDPRQAFGYVGAGQFMVLIDRGDYWQCAYVIRKGSFEKREQRGLQAFRDEVAQCAPFLAERTREIAQWEDVKLLTVKVNHLRKWYREGLLCIGDAAHAMSPVGGVGINLAIQDAVATANLLAPKLRTHTVKLSDLKAVQTRRERAANVTQRVQVFLHKNVLEPIFESRETVAPPALLKLVERYPRLRRIPGRMLGMGFRPEHIRTE
jgi:2-polyprenyl-6-methoxyphenol hydroxylase-like FAD-dependent oxidoreductase